MSETNSDPLNKPIGTEENTIKPAAQLEILDVKVIEVGEKKFKKVEVSVKHPAVENAVKLSSAKYERKGNLAISGLFLNLDSEGNIQKGSAVAELMKYLSCATLAEMKGKKIDTVLDNNQYLCLKAY